MGMSWTVERWRLPWPKRKNPARNLDPVRGHDPAVVDPAATDHEAHEAVALLHRARLVDIGIFWSQEKI